MGHRRLLEDEAASMKESGIVGRKRKPGFLRAMILAMAAGALPPPRASFVRPHMSRRRIANPAGSKLLRRAYKHHQGQRGSYVDAAVWYGKLQ